MTANTSSEEMKSPRNIQQMYFEALGYTDWDYFERGNIYLIKQKIAYSMFGEPNNPSDLIESDETSTFGYDDAQFKHVLLIYDKICEFKKFSADQNSIYFSVIFVCCVPKNRKISDINSYENVLSDNIYVSPVYIVRKCIKADMSDNLRGCCIFVDGDARVYKTWADYLKNNNQPKGVIVAPKNGHYNGNICNETVHVNLEITLSPACSVLAIARDVGNIASAAVSLGAVGVLTVAAFTPIGPIAAGTSLAATAITGIYGSAVSIAQITDRAQHEQSIGLQNAESRACWLNLGASTMGIVAGASSKILSTAAKNGANIGKGIMVAHDATIVLSVLTGGAGLANGIANAIIKYMETKEKPTKLEVFQMSSSLFFFTNSLMSNRMASTVIENSQTSAMMNIRENLASNKLRRIYDKVVAETRRVNGRIRGNSEIINGVNRIENVNQFFRDVLRMNTQLNENSVRISINNGNVVLNGAHIINPQEFLSLSISERSSYLTNIGPANLSTANVPTRLLLSGITPSVSSTLPILNILAFAKELVDTFPDLSTATSDDILQYISCKIYAFAQNLNIFKKFVTILKAVQRCIDSYMKEQLACMGIYGNDIILRIFSFVYDYFKNICEFDDAFPQMIESIFNGDYLDELFIYNVVKYFKAKLLIDYKTSVEISREIRCNVCNGLTFCGN